MCIFVGFIPDALLILVMFLKSIYAHFAVPNWLLIVVILVKYLNSGNLRPFIDVVLSVVPMELAPSERH